MTQSLNPLLDDKVREVYAEDFAPDEHCVYGESNLVFNKLAIFGIVELLNFFRGQDTHDGVPEFGLLELELAIHTGRRDAKTDLGLNEA